MSHPLPVFVLTALGSLLSIAAHDPSSGQSAALDFEFHKLDGKTVRGPLEAANESRFVCRESELALSDLWFFHGPATSILASGKVEIRLQTGERLVGDVLGGDEDGEALTLRSSTFGTVDIALDAVALLRVRGESGFPDPARYVSAKTEDDTIFRETPLGFDPIRGVLESVDAKGLRFEVASGRSELFTWDRIAGLKLPALEAPQPGPGARIVLLLRDGSRLHGRPTALADAKLAVKHATLGDLRIPLDGILGGHVIDDASRVLVSSLQPVEVGERDLFADRPLYPWRRDANVLGHTLEVRRRYWTTGLGAHAQCKLDFVVPADAKTLRTWIGADDSAVQNRRIGDMRFRILRGDEVLADVESVKGGQVAQPLPPIPVEQGQRIRFEIDFGKALHTLDRGNWLAPVFVR